MSAKREKALVVSRFEKVCALRPNGRCRRDACVPVRWRLPCAPVQSRLAKPHHDRCLQRQYKDRSDQQYDDPIRRLPDSVDTTPISQLNVAAPMMPAMNSGAALRVASGPKIRVKRTMFVGKIADVPSPAIAAPTVANVSLVTINEHADKERYRARSR
jgi:hypothetical protein